MDRFTSPTAFAADKNESHASPSWYRWLFDQSLDGILLTTPRGEILAANPAICDLLGYSEAEICRLGRAGIVDTEDPRLAVALEQRRASGRLIAELTCIASDGRRIPVDVTSHIFTDEEGNEMTSIFVRDATERLRAETSLRETADRFRMTLRNSPTNVFTADADLRYTWTYKPPRLAPNENIIGLRDDEIFPPEQVAELVALKREVIETGRSLRREVRVAIGDEEHVYDMAVEPIRDASGVVTGLTAAATDITEHWVHEKERSQLLEIAVEARRSAELEAERARHATELRDRVLAIVSHDLRNPLAAIAMALSAVSRETAPPRPESLEWFIDITRPALAHMQRLIRDLLDVANIEQGRLSLTRAPTDVRVLMEQARKAFADRFEAAAIQLDYELTHDLPPAFIDGERILQVIGNLLSNTLNILPRGSTVSLGARHEENVIVIFVRDTGPGIAAVDLPHIFEPYWRSREVRGEGYGLGLSISRSIIEAHAGRIWVDTAQDQGTSFAFCVPVAT